MALNIEYDSLEEVTMRLGSTIVRYDGEPVYVSNVSMGDDGVPRIHILPLPVKTMNDYDEVRAEPKTLRKVVNSRHFDFEPFLLGYANLAKWGAIFLTRAPVRKFKQGLNSGNLVNDKGVNFKTLMADEGFKQALKNEYPTLGEAVSKAKAKSITVAFCRELAVSSRELGYFILEYKGTECAFSEDGSVFKLPEQFQYLKQVLLENGVAFR